MRFSPSAVGTYQTALTLFSNDSVLGHNPWQVVFSGRLEHIGFAVQGVKKDTLDFGAIACGGSKDTSFAIMDLSTIPASFTAELGDSTLFAVQGESRSGSLITVHIRYAGGAPSSPVVPLFIRDTCGATDTIYLKAEMQAIAVTLAQGDTAICVGDSLAIVAPAGFASYQWSDSETTRRIVVKNSGEYSVEVIDSGGCAGISNAITVSVLPLPTPAISYTGTLSICTGDSVRLSAPSGFITYQWSDGETSQHIIVKNADTLTVT